MPSIKQNAQQHAGKRAGSGTQAYIKDEGDNDVLEYNAESILVPGHPFVLDNAGVRQPFDKVDLTHKLRNFLLLEAFKPDPLHSDHLPGVQVERAIHSTKLSASNTIPKLLEEERTIPVNYRLPANGGPLT